MTIDLSVEVGSLKLANPIIAASGTFGYGLEFAHLFDLNRLGGFVVKGLSLEPINGSPAPRLCETPSGMLNAVGLQNVGVQAFVAQKLPRLKQFRSAVIANVFGTSVEEYVEVIRILEDAEGLAAYELNISCPNVKKGGMQFGSDPHLLDEVVRVAKRVARRPLIVKLSPNVTSVALMAHVLTAWPAADEISRPYLGYVTRPMRVVQIEDFSLEQVMSAAELRSSFDVVLVFSTQRSAARSILERWPAWEGIKTRYLGFRHTLPAAAVAQILGGEVVYSASQNGQWIAVIELERVVEAELQPIDRGVCAIAPSDGRSAF